MIGFYEDGGKWEALLVECFVKKRVRRIGRAEKEQQIGRVFRGTSDGGHMQLPNAKMCHMVHRTPVTSEHSDLTGWELYELYQPEVPSARSSTPLLGKQFRSGDLIFCTTTLIPANKGAKLDGLLHNGLAVVLGFAVGFEWCDPLAHPPDHPPTRPPARPSTHHPTTLQPAQPTHPTHTPTRSHPPTHTHTLAAPTHAPTHALTH